MLRLNEPQEFWGIAHASTGLTGSLWCPDQFVFKHQAEDYCKKVRELGVAHDLRPVLVTMTATLASEEEANAYDDRQIEFLAKRRAKATA